MPAENIEFRVIPNEDIELRVTDDSKPKITGYAAKYNKWSVDLGGFTERIKPGAFDKVLTGSDVRALKNHNPNLLLGRTASGTLRLSSNSVGLQFEIDVPDTTTGRDMVEEIRRKDITGCSFAFKTKDDEWKNNEDGTVQRTIIEVSELLDIGPVTYPAYSDTTVAVRSLNQFVKSKTGGEKTEQSKIIDKERMLKTEKGYREAGYRIARNKSAKV